MKNARCYSRVVWQLLVTDFMLFRRVLVTKLVDRGVWLLTYIAVVGHVMPAMGVPVSLGVLCLSGAIATMAILESYTDAVSFIADFEGNQTISYILTLPVPSSLVFVGFIISHALRYAVLALCLLPLGNFLLGSRGIPYESIAWGKFVVIFVLINIFYGALVVWFAGIGKSMQFIGRIWPRFVFPAWYLGGLQFSWYPVHELFGWASYFLLINPIMHSTEAMRAALLGQSGFLPFWPCTGMLVLFTVAMSWHGIVRLKRRLDFV